MAALALAYFFWRNFAVNVDDFLQRDVVDDEICVQGYIMDYFCIKSVRMIDNGKKTLEEPVEHTVHCLLDVDICYNSHFEVLVDPEQSGDLYTRGYRLTDGSKQRMLDLGRSIGSCSTCVNGYDGDMQKKGFRAVMTATVVDLNENDNDAPPLIRTSDIRHSNNLGSDPCRLVFNMTEGVGVPSPTSPGTADSSSDVDSLAESSDGSKPQTRFFCQALVLLVCASLVF